MTTDPGDRGWRSAVRKIPLWLWLGIFAPVIVGVLHALGVLG
jgi:hypothetical protein